MSSNHCLVIANDELFGWGRNMSPSRQRSCRIPTQTSDHLSTPTKIKVPGKVPSQIATGYQHSLVLCNDGTVVSCGCNEFGQLGTPPEGRDGNDQDNFAKVLDLPGDIIKIACGSHHSMALSRDSGLFCWGYNEYGQLGIGSNVSQHTPQRVKILEADIKEIGCGGYFSMSLTENGDLYSWGNNSSGELALGPKVQYTPKKIARLPRIMKFRCGFEHVLALAEDGSLYSWGCSEQLGRDPLVASHLIPSKIPALPPIIDIACGSAHSMAYSREGELFVWGDNEQGQLGLGSTLRQNLPTRLEGFNRRIIQMKCGYLHSMVLTPKQDIYVWGNNSFGQLGKGETVLLRPKKLKGFKFELEKNYSQVTNP